MWDAASGATLQAGTSLYGRVVAVQHPHEFMVRIVREGSWRQRPDAPPDIGSTVRYGPERRTGRVERVAGARCDLLLESGEPVCDAAWAGDQLLPARWDEPCPPLELRCRLHRAEPLDPVRGWSARSVASFVRLAGHGALRIAVRSVARDGLVEVDLDGYEYPESVTMMMVLTGAARWGLENNQVDPCRLLELPNVFYYKYDQLPLGIQMETTLVHVSGSSFYLIRRKRFFKCRDMNGELKNCFEDCKRVRENDLVEDLPVLCKHKHKTHNTFCFLRGIIIHVSDSKKKVLVYFVDRGGEDIIPVSEDFLRHPTQQMLEEPALAVHCNFTTSQEDDRNIYAQMKLGANLFVKTEETGEGFKKPHVVKVIIEKGL